MNIWAARVVVGVFYSVTMGVFALFLVWHFQGDPRDTVSRTILTPEVKAGDDLMIRISAVMERTCEVDIQREIIDGEGTLHTSVSMRAERDQGAETIVIRSTVPSAAAPGRAYYRVFLEWRCNPLQKIWPRVVQLPDLAFTITEGKIP